MQNFTEAVSREELRFAYEISAQICHSYTPELFSNYRPISVLPRFSKILEQIIYNRIINNLNDFNVLCDNQYGFWKNRSPSLALIADLCDRISSAFDRREYAIGVFLDLSKPFDMVNHAILFDKLEHDGIRGLALEWVKSHFSERAQFVECNNVRSSPQGISRGLPQGSILCPLFFILDLNNASLLDVILFAHDTNLFISHNDPGYLNDALSSQLTNLSTWFAAIRLSLNLSKTNFMVFKPRQKKQLFEFHVSINELPKYPPCFWNHVFGCLCTRQFELEIPHISIS